LAELGRSVSEKTNMQWDLVDETSETAIPTQVWMWVLPTPTNQII
jgi:hypothetical protein